MLATASRKEFRRRCPAYVEAAARILEETLVNLNQENDGS